MSVYGFCPGVSITGSLTINDEMCPTVRAQANNNTPAVAYAVRMRAGCDGGGKGALVQEGVSGTLATGNDQTLFQPESSGYIVRRLTPLECERLQGMPDDHTKVPYRGKPADECPDGARYKAIGNSMAVPCMSWIGRRLQEVDELLRDEGEGLAQGDRTEDAHETEAQ